MLTTHDYDPTEKNKDDYDGEDVDTLAAALEEDLATVRQRMRAEPKVEYHREGINLVPVPRGSSESKYRRDPTKGNILTKD